MMLHHVTGVLNKIYAESPDTIHDVIPKILELITSSDLALKMGLLAGTMVQVAQTHPEVRSDSCYLFTLSDVNSS